ncbi:MAG: NAD-dependent epimerase/dehydratase family protein [Phycisphaerales bacterium JB063]
MPESTATTHTAVTALDDDVTALDLEHLLRSLRQEFETMAGSSLLITGGAGFLGYYLVQAVLAWNRRAASPDQQIHITVYDNYMRGVPAWLTALEHEPTLTLCKYDVIKPLPGDMPDFDYIVHAAGIASPKYYRLHPLETMDANINGLRSFLEHARQRQGTERPVRGLLFFSSSEIYGDPDPAHIPTTEDYRGYVSCTGPRACYDESKRYGETLCVVYAQQYGVPVKVARPFNNYGPGLKISDRRVIPDFARDVLAGRPIVMLSNGKPSRTFCYSADAIAGYLKVLVRGRAGEAYNIGTESPEISMMDLAERIVTVGRELLGYEGEVVRQASDEKDYLVDNPQRRCPSIAKARAELDYDPAIGLDEGLRRSLVWYHQNPHAEDA